MHDRAHQNKKVPNGVGILPAFPNIKENTQRIEQTAEDKKGKADLRQFLNQLV